MFIKLSKSSKWSSMWVILSAREEFGKSFWRVTMPLQEGPYRGAHNGGSPFISRVAFTRYNLFSLIASLWNSTVSIILSFRQSLFLVRKHPFFFFNFLMYFLKYPSLLVLSSQDAYPHRNEDVPQGSQVILLWPFQALRPLLIISHVSFSYFLCPDWPDRVRFYKVCCKHLIFSITSWPIGRLLFSYLN